MNNLKLKPIIQELLGVFLDVFLFTAYNCIGLGAMAIDKYKAQKARWRIPEKTLFLITLLGGGIGTITGMYMFRHKTKKLYFTIGFPTILIAEISLIIYACIKYGDVIFI